jgi:polyisoprenoid-binding protein YceI
MSGRGILAGVIVLGAALLPWTDSIATEYVLDPARTGVRFEMRSLGTVQRGEFNQAAGSVTLDSQSGSGQLDIVLDARSVEAGSPAVESFLRGPALLDVGNHPEILYRAKNLTFVDGGLARIEGELTLLGITLPVPLAVTRHDCTSQDSPLQRCFMVAVASFKRSAFGMTRYRMFADDEVKLEIHAEGVRLAAHRLATTILRAP